MGDLNNLIAAVEAGTALWADFRGALFKPSSGNAFDAYNGSLDAVMRLHEALLPGWNVQRLFGPYRNDPHWRITIKDMALLGGVVNAIAPTPARAWLLAILRALQAKSTPDADTAAIRHHERFGPLDEHGNPLDPRRRG